MKVAILVPFRPDGSRRDELAAWTTARLRAEHPDWSVEIGEHLEGPFNRSAAINSAAARHPDADVYVVADSDSFVAPAQLREAVDWALSGGPEFGLAFTTFRYLSRAMSDQIMAGYCGDWLSGVEFSMTGTCSSMVVCTARLFREVGGFCEAFEGWGFEDVAFSLAAQTFGGGLFRTEGDAWHLWHPTSTENNHEAPEWQRNRHLCNERFGPAAYDRPAMRALLDELQS